MLHFLFSGSHNLDNEQEEWCHISNEAKTLLCFLVWLSIVTVSDGRYVEPSIRPDDSRYGENPNRLQRHTQFQVSLPSIYCLTFWITVDCLVLLYDFIVLLTTPDAFPVWTAMQVILKPDPGNSQDLFIRSLSALGFATYIYFLFLFPSLCLLD